MIVYGSGWRVCVQVCVFGQQDLAEDDRLCKKKKNSAFPRLRKSQYKVRGQ